jgi:dienelactone hydrolase
MTRGEGRIVSEDFGGLWPLDKPWEQLVVLHARANAPLATAGGRLPVVIFSHGMTMLRDLYVSYLEDLASWGFVVAAISHTYDSSAVEYSDGVVGLNTTYWTTNPSNPAPAEADAHIAVWVADARFVADQLTTWNASDPLSRFTGRLDLDKLGMFGHSYGGATAGEACFADPRFKAGANFDGNFFSPARATGGRAVSQPFMIQLAASNQYHDTSFDSFFGKLQIGYQVTIADSVHMDYSDYSLIVKQFASASPAMKWFGSGDYLRILAVSRAYNLAFFKKHLRGDPQPLLDGSSPSFPEATFKKKP